MKPNRKRKEAKPKKDYLFQPGNELWNQRHTDGRHRKYETPEQLWNDACEYFQWCIDNPLKKDEGFAFQGIVTHDDFSLMRAMSIKGLAVFLGVTSKYFDNLEKQFEGKDDKLSVDFLHIITRIREIVFTQKFEGAAAGLLNANIIARELGLAEKQEIAVDPESKINIYFDGKELTAKK